MSGSQMDESDLAYYDAIPDYDLEIRRLELQLILAKIKSNTRRLEEMARQKKLKELGYNAGSAALDNEEYPAFTAKDFG